MTVRGKRGERYRL